MFILENSISHLKPLSSLYIILYLKALSIVPIYLHLTLVLFAQLMLRHLQICVELKNSNDNFMSICGLFDVLCLVSRWPLIRRRKRGAPVGQPAGPAWVRHPSSCQLHRNTSQNILGALHTSCFNNHTVHLN